MGRTYIRKAERRVEKGRVNAAKSLMEMRSDVRPDTEGRVDASKEKALDDAWTFVMRNVEHLVHEVQPDADEHLVESVRQDLETNKIMILMECAGRDQVSLRIRQEIRTRLAGKTPKAVEEKKAA